MAFSLAMAWSEGEKKMQELLDVPDLDNPTSSMLTPQASFMLQNAPLLALGTLDSKSRPWTALWGGIVGFTEILGGGYIGTKTLVNSKNDPVVQALVGDVNWGMTLQQQEGGKMIAGLTIDLITRKRVKIAGKMVAGTLKKEEIESESTEEQKGAVPDTHAQIQLIMKIEQSLGNCPKYLNQYKIEPALLSSELVSQGPELSDAGKALIEQCDMFFLTTSTQIDMDTNHRGGLPGFVRIISSNQIIFPEYSGNRFYQSLGNLLANDRIGLTFPNYETGEVLYTTGTATILVGTDAARLLPGSNLAVQIRLEETIFVKRGLPFRGERKLRSPYNPLVRTLASEGNMKSFLSPSTIQSARLVKKVPLTPSIARFTFAVSGGVTYLPGQWVALDFKSELDIGYSHMRNDDPRSLNDDFVRTFTISSTPIGNEREFEITVRKVGPVTDHLFRQNERSGFEVPMLGVGGDFTVVQTGDGITPFLAGGVGITPLLGQL
ncbi:oxidoreductase-like protein [Dothidotthia symphoricarpi CBS 119687]|uniref:Oxidoreductase-like protein n=1 Tax=Dothidotthia symphoricarpi CBS 119687 TaxID=1392245 RepID=A0A6A6ACA3_9PLEO|nr:oxidoreductase-like protein [Dothidotthia symphoricarpi CBS 119687]KAF2128863.1 oxidoreductase-like protein [Dothidotthia symphoricarpi CBS 119687]